MHKKWQGLQGKACCERISGRDMVEHALETIMLVGGKKIGAHLSLSCCVSPSLVLTVKHLQKNLDA